MTTSFTTPPKRVVFFAIAGENLGGHRAVYIHEDGKAYLADRSSLLEAVGVTDGAVEDGAMATVVSLGRIGGMGGLTGGDILWLGESGELTTEVPSSNLLQELARAVDASSIFVQLKQSFFL